MQQLVKTTSVKTNMDTFFLDLEQAYHEAEKQNKIITDNGKERLQYCYYDGPLTDSPLENLIQVTQSEFVDFFSLNTLPIPARIIYKNGHQIDLISDSPDIIEDIIHYRETNKHKPPKHKDTYFIDQLQALNTAKQCNSVPLLQRGSSDQITSKQLCFYHGEALNLEQYRSLINVNLNEMIPYFSETSLRFPSELLLHEGLESALKNEIGSHFKAGIDTALHNKKASLDNLIKQASKSNPDFNEEQLRVFIPVNTLTGKQNDGKQSLKKTSEFLENNGFSVLIEKDYNEFDDLESINSIKEYIEYNPHFTFQRNALDNSYQSLSCINIVLWDQITSQIEQFYPFKTNKNDYIFSDNQEINYYLLRCHIDKPINIPKSLEQKSINEQLVFLIKNHLKLNQSQKQKSLKKSSLNYNNIILESNSDAFFGHCQNLLNKNLESLKIHHFEFYEKVINILKTDKIKILCNDYNDKIYSALEVCFNNQNLFKLNQYLLNKSLNIISEKHEISTSLVMSFGSGCELLEIYKHTHKPVDGHTMEIPIYIIEENIQYFIFNLIIHDLSEILSSKRVYIFIEQSIQDYEKTIMHNENPVPGYTVTTRSGTSTREMDKLSQDIFHLRTDNSNALKEKVEEYYSAFSDKQWKDKFSPENISSLRVLGLTSRFTSFLKYCMRDLIDGFQRQGATTFLFSETDDHKRMTNDGVIEIINKFKPDLIIIIDHFRSEYPTVPKSVPFVNWIQDMLPNITENKISPSERDYTFVFAERWVDLAKNLPIYKDHPVHFLHLGYNDKVYYPSLEKTVHYDCDILSATHLPQLSTTFYPIHSPESHEFILNIYEQKAVNGKLINEEQIKEVFYHIYLFVKDMSLVELSDFCLIPDTGITKFVENLLKKYEFKDNEEIKYLFDFKPQTRFANEFFLQMKIRPLATLINSDINFNIHLYGNRWEQIPLFEPYSKGVAKNGIELNHLMHHAKICLNISPGTTLHMRAIEIIASGAFMLSRKINNDSSPIDSFFEEDEEVIFYKDESELISLAGYYMNNEDARQIITKKASKKLYETFSYESISKKIATTIAESFC